MRLYLIRHGQTSWNAEGRAQGHTDIPLDEEGRRQAQALANIFKDTPLSEVRTSDLKRSFQTAEGVAKITGAKLVQDARLRERGFGEWEGMPFTHFHALTPHLSDESFFSFRPPGGESFEDVWIRLDGVVEELEQSTADRAIVSHGGTTAILLARLLNGTHITARSFRFGNTSVVELNRRHDGFYTMLRYNDMAHLRSEVLTGDLDGAHR
jgi:broad specificity phosphatase PhoE